MAKILRKNSEQNPGAPLALFDLDYTILAGDSEAMWIRFLFEKGVVDKGFLMRITDYYHAYDNGHLDIHEYQAFLLRPLTLHPLSKLHEWRLGYLQQVRQIVRPNIMRRVKRFRMLGFTLLLITASNNFIAEPIAKMLRFPHLICTRIKPSFCATRSDSLKNGIESQDFGFGSGACAWSQG